MTRHPFAVVGFTISCQFDTLPELFDSLKELLTERVYKFLGSEMGKCWFYSTISDYIFPYNVKFDPDYAENIGVSILAGVDPKYKFQKYDQAAKKVSISDSELIQFSRGVINSVPPHLWVVSAYSEDQLRAIIEGSTFHTNLESLDKKLRWQNSPVMN